MLKFEEIFVLFFRLFILLPLFHFLHNFHKYFFTMYTLSSLALSTIFLLNINTISSLPDGLALSPPMGFRTWNQFGGKVNQSLMLQIVDAMVKPITTNMSLASLKYTDVGIDDGWQLCDSGANKGFHNSSGWPNVNTAIFPDLRVFTSYAHEHNLTAGFYGNNCECADHSTLISYFMGDVNNFIYLDFDSYKLDSCGGLQDIQLYQTLLNQTSKKRIVIENCHNGPWLPEAPRKPNSLPWCPFHFYRSSLDVRADYFSVMGVNLQTIIPLATEGLSYPGCFAYPDMLEVGVTPGVHAGEVGLTHIESRSHFAAWSIVSSPLILGLDVRNITTVNSVWDIIANTEMISINQAWAADSRGYIGPSNVVGPFSTNMMVSGSYSGTRIAYSNDTKTFDPCGWYSNCTIPVYEIWSKPLIMPSKTNGDTSSIAVLFLNHGDTTITTGITLGFDSIPGLVCPNNNCYVRDIYSHTNLGTFTDNYVFNNIASHDSVYLIISSSPNNLFGENM